MKLIIIFQYLSAISTVNIFIQFWFLLLRTRHGLESIHINTNTWMVVNCTMLIISIHHKVGLKWFFFIYWSLIHHLQKDDYKLVTWLDAWHLMAFKGMVPVASHYVRIISPNRVINVNACAMLYICKTEHIFIILYTMWFILLFIMFGSHIVNIVMFLYKLVIFQINH